jgi:hypothetical protein
MSWSVNSAGPREDVKASVSEQFDGCAKSYEGKPEADDILSCKGRALALLDALSLGEGDTASVYGYGSHSTTYPEGNVLEASFNLAVKRVSAEKKKAG